MSETLKCILCVGTLLCVAGLAVPLVAFSPVAGRPVVVVFPPWTDRPEPARVVWDAGGYILDETAASLIAIGPDKEFFTKLREGGALMVFDAKNAGSLCVAPPEAGTWNAAQVIE